MEVTIIIFGILSIILLAAIIIAVKSVGKVNKYDERQLQMQGKAIKIAYYSLNALLAIYAFLQAVCDFPVTTSAAILFCIFTSVAIYAFVCIVTDAYVAPNNSPSRFYILLIIGGITNTINGINGVLHESGFTDGKLNIYPVTLYLGILVFMLLITLLIHNLRGRRAE